MLDALLGRRSLLAGLAACAAPNAFGAPSAFPEGATLLVAGAPGGRADRWADALSPSLGRALAGASLTRQHLGGADGVTGANQFEARAAPDGATALLVPGSAALARLSGDSRVRFDAARWVPVWASQTSAALASRVRLMPGRPLRLAVSSVVGPEMAGLLALELLGIDALAVPMTDNPVMALARPEIDAVFLSGPYVREDAAALAAAGMPLAFTLGALNAAGETVRDPAYPDLPSAEEAIAKGRPDAPAGLQAARRAVTAAVQLDVALVLPQLSPASMVAWWRRGCSSLAQSPEIQGEAARSGARLANPQAGRSNTAAVAADVPALLELRRWLSERHNWRPA